LGHALLAQGCIEDARAVLEKAIALNSSDASAFNNMGK
jgi:Flp pilus assembly protein TadD